MRSAPNALALAGALLLSAATAQGAQAGPAPLRWQSAPRPGALLRVDAARPFSLRVAAVAAKRGARVRLSVLGASPMRLRGHPGNPAVGVLTYSPERPAARDAFSVTLVARSGRIAITRTIVVSLRRHPASLVGPGSRRSWAYVLARTFARTRPDPHARVVAEVPVATSDGRPNLVPALARQTDATGGEWLRVRLTALPNGLTGWVPRSHLSSLRVVQTLIVVDTRRLTLTLAKRGRIVFRARVGVGRRRWPTPRGTFYVREKLTGLGGGFYGPIAFGTNARSAELTDWPDGGIVGIHGTNAPSLIPGRISHGCIRLRNRDIVRLARKLPLGTPIVVR
jgi:L,D-transpeptidase-like protein